MSAPDVLCLGEPLYEFAQRADGMWQTGFGGDVSNVAIAVQRQGLRAGMLTRLGQDSFGDAFLEMWAGEGVDTSFVERDATQPTGVYFIRQGPEGHTFEYRRAGSAASHLDPGKIGADALAGARVLHASGISQAISDSAARTVAGAIEHMRAAGGLVSFDPNLRLNLWPLERARDAIHGAMSRTDIALPGLEDARLLTGLADPGDIVRFYLDLGPSVVALTLGAEGALIATAEGVRHIPSPPTQVVDASGAGDCFDGAFLAEWLRTGNPEDAGRYAVAAASLSVGGIGATAAIPREPAVRAANGPESADAAPKTAEPPQRLALVAHDLLKPDMAAWVAEHAGVLANHHIVATGTTAGIIRKAAPGLSVMAVKSRPLGGDQQIGGMIAEGRITALIFFADPLTPMPHDVDVKALLRIALVMDTPCAFSRATADLLIRSGHLVSEPLQAS